jgi:hypothetical protein
MLIFSISHVIRVTKRKIVLNQQIKLIYHHQKNFTALNLISLLKKHERVNYLANFDKVNAYKRSDMQWRFTPRT